MGMCYMWSGSASYPRFDRELCAVAEVFGGVKSDHLKARESTENERPLGHWFGFLSSDFSKEQKFLFPAGTNEVLVRWFNDIYGDFTTKETQTVADLIFQHNEIKDLSHQIWNELHTCKKLNESWNIYL